MKRLIFLIFLFLSVNVYAQPALLMVTEDYPPYEYEENGVPKGLDIEIINAASERLKVKVEIIFMPWARAMTEVRNGRADAIFSLFRTNEREAFLYFTTEHLGNEKNILITNKESRKEASNINDIQGWTIGVVAHNSYGKAFDENKYIHRQKVTHIDQLIKMAALGNRFDAAIVNDLVFSYTVEKMKMTERFKKLDFIVNDQPLYLGFSKAKGKSHQQISENYSQILKQLREEGVIDKIVQKYTSN